MKRLYSSNIELNKLETQTINELNNIFLKSRKSLEKELPKLLEKISLYPDDMGYKLKLEKNKKLLRELTNNLVILKGKPKTMEGLIKNSTVIGTKYAVDTIKDLSGVSAVKAFLQTETIVSLVKNANKYLFKYDDILKDRIIENLGIGLTRGDSISKMKETLIVQYQMVSYKAERLVRTESISAFNDANMYQYRDSGIEQVQITAGLEDSGRVCEECADEHGKVYSIDDCPTVPFHFNCRCTILPYSDKWNVDLDKYENQRDTLMSLHDDQEE